MTANDVISLRKRLNMTQSEFAERFNLNVRTLQDWEQGRRQLTSVAIALLYSIEKQSDK